MRLVWSRQADADKEAIWLFLSDRNVAYADRVDRRIDARVASLPRLPRQGRPIGGGNRRLSLADMRLVIDYRIEDDAIRILRVRNTAQDYE